MLSQALALTKCVLDFTIFSWIFSFFFSKRVFKKYKISIVGVIVLTSLILQAVNSMENAIINTITITVCSIIICFVLYSGRFFQQLLCSIVCVVLLVSLEFLPIALLSAHQSDTLNRIMSSTISDAQFNMISTGLLCSIALIMKFYIQYKYRRQNRDYGFTSNYFSILVPILSIGVAYYILYIDQVVIADENLGIINTFIFILLVTVNFGFFLGENEVEKRNTLQRKLLELRHQENTIKLALELQDAHIAEITGLMHDYKREISGIDALISNEQNQGEFAYVKRCLSEMNEIIDDTNRFIHIESKPLQIILNQTSNICEEYGIDFSLDIRYGKFDFMTYPDIYALFDNALENAINACNNTKPPSPKRISLKILKTNDVVLVEISNSFQCDTTSSNRVYDRGVNEHGYGLRNMKKIVKKYNGNLCINTQEDYNVYITLPVHEWISL